jgi:hypothetical protein
MALSVLRIRLIHSPFDNWMRPLRPLEGWIYHKLRQAPPRPRQPDSSPPLQSKPPENSSF